MNKAKEYIARQARAAQVNNSGVGRVVTLAKDGRHTVEVESGRMIMVYSASGENYNPGDIVSIRYLSKDKRQAEIAGRTTRRLAAIIRRVSR